MGNDYVTNYEIKKKKISLSLSHFLCFLGNKVAPPQKHNFSEEKKSQFLS